MPSLLSAQALICSFTCIKQKDNLLLYSRPFGCPEVETDSRQSLTAQGSIPLLDGAWLSNPLNSHINALRWRSQSNAIIIHPKRSGGTVMRICALGVVLALLALFASFAQAAAQEAPANSAANRASTAPLSPSTQPSVPAGAERFGDWFVLPSQSRTHVAMTQGLGGTYLLVGCETICRFVVGGVAGCDQDNHKARGLANLPRIGVTWIGLVCANAPNMHGWFANFGPSCMQTLSSGDRVTLAIPDGDGDFTVVVFGLTGALQAAQRAFALSPAGAGDTSGRGLAGVLR